MILDYDNELTSRSGTTSADGQAVTATAIGGKVIDGKAAKDWGSGEALVPYFKVTSKAASNPTTSMTVTIEGADNAALSTNAVVLSTRTVLTAALTAGAIFRMPPLQPGVSKQFVGCRFTPNGGSATTGEYVVGFLSDNADASPQNIVNSV
jgi:hypothetical protein